MSSWAHARTPTPTHSCSSERIKQVMCLQAAELRCSKVPISNCLKLARKFRPGQGEDVSQEEFSPGEVRKGEADLLFCGRYIAHGEESLRGVSLTLRLL